MTASAGSRLLQWVSSLWMLIGIGHLVAVDILMLLLRVPFLTDVEADRPVLDFLRSHRVAFHPAWLASPTFLASFKGFSIWLGVSCLGQGVLQREYLRNGRTLRELKRLAVLNSLLGGTFCTLSIWGFFVVPTVLSATILLLACACALRLDDGTGSEPKQAAS